ncbi:MAG: YicC/YloC family endoribonuclease [Candidatus Babeliales bacterium]
MVQSMTGFASKTITLKAADGAHTQATLSIKSLNSRYFETTCKIPLALQQLETKIIQLFKNDLVRGHAYFTIYLADQAFLQSQVKPALSTAKNYLDALRSIQSQFSVEGHITMSDLVRLPIFSIEERAIDSACEQQIMNATQELINELIKVRAVEGKSLQKDLEARIAFVAQEIVGIEKIAERVMADRKALIGKKIAELDVQDQEYANMRRNTLCNELDKIDVHEEIVRFKTHLAAFDQILKADYAEKGRRVDFTLQELGREINTIAAKCSDAAIGSMAINIKVELEKAREQAQNIV